MRIVTWRMRILPALQLEGQQHNVIFTDIHNYLVATVNLYTLELMKTSS